MKKPRQVILVKLPVTKVLRSEKINIKLNVCNKMRWVIENAFVFDTF